MCQVRSWAGKIISKAQVLWSELFYEYLFQTWAGAGEVSVSKSQRETYDQLFWDGLTGEREWIIRANNQHTKQHALQTNTYLTQTNILCAKGPCDNTGAVSAHEPTGYITLQAGEESYFQT